MNKQHQIDLENLCESIAEDLSDKPDLFMNIRDRKDKTIEQKIEMIRGELKVLKQFADSYPHVLEDIIDKIKTNYYDD